MNVGVGVQEECVWPCSYLLKIFAEKMLENVINVAKN